MRIRRCNATLRLRRGCVLGYMQRYGRFCTGSSSISCEQASRIHNGGPLGCRNSNTLGYWNKVRACYGGK